MVSGKHKKVPFYKKLQLLPSITNSHTRNRSPIILDNIPSKHVQRLMEVKVEKTNQDNEASHDYGGSTNCPNSKFPVVKVEAQERGFIIKVFIERSCPGLLVFVLEAFEELGLDVLHARVSCSHNFLLEAIVITDDNKLNRDKDAQTVEQAMFQAIQSWSEVSQPE